MTFTFTTKLLVPAAGFGKRVGSPKAKELLVLKQEENALIDWTLELAKQYQMPAVIISREDKIELNEYIKSIKHKYPVEVCLIPASREWPDTLLKSETHWADKNIVVLPDTRFTPTHILKDMDTSLALNQYAFATFEVSPLDTWGVIRSSDTGFSVAEKPKQTNASDRAWGVFGFQKNYGKKLLQAMLASQGKFISFSTAVSSHELASFEDVGRSGIEPFK